MGERSGKPGTESTAALTTSDLSLLVTCKLEKTEFIAGGPIDLDFSITNTGRHDIFYLAGETGGRPAYLKFSGHLQPSGLELRDPHPHVGTEPDGPVTAVKVEPGATSARTIILNQFLTLEDARATLAFGRNAGLDIHWEAHIHAAGKAAERREAERVGGGLQTNLLRDDEKLRQSIQSLADKLTDEWQAVSSDPVGQRHAILALAALRIPEVMPYLARLVDFPELEVQRRAQHALSELQK